MIQHELDGLAQLFAVLPGHREGAERMRVGVARAAGDEQGNGTRMVGLDPVLGIAGEISGDLHHIGPERGVVAGVSEDDGQRFTARVLNAEDRHTLVGGSGGILAELDPLGGRLAPIQGEVGATDAVGQTGRLHPGERLADQRDDLVLELARVGDVGFEALAHGPASCRAVGRFDERGPGVVVRREQDEVLARQSVLGLDPVGHAVGERAPEADDVAGDQDDLVIVRVGQRKGLGDERVRHALRGGRPRCVARHPDR